MTSKDDRRMPKPRAHHPPGSAIDTLSRDLSHSRQIAQRFVQGLENETCDKGEVEGLSPERTLLLEEHMASIALRWIAHQQPQDIEQIPLRDFSQLTRLLMDLVERRQRLEQKSVEPDIGGGISPKQYAAMRQVLMGEIVEG